MLKHGDETLIEAVKLGRNSSDLVRIVIFASLSRDVVGPNGTSWIEEPDCLQENQ